MKSTTLLIALVAFATGVYAGPTAPITTGPTAAPTMELFGPGWELGGHALFLTPQAHRASNAWGGGVDVDYFFTPYVGLEGTAAWASPHSRETENSHLNYGNYTLDVILRLPFEAYHIAPYIIGGGGMISAKSDFNGDRVNKWLGQVGAGVEFKPVAKFSIFADWIYNFPGASGDVPNYQEIRMGLKFGL